MLKLPSINPLKPPPATVELEVSGGRVRGLAKDGVRLFRGIPFAAPPVGPLRFAPPQPAEPWVDTLDCTRFRPSSLQPGRFDPAIQHDEDCLYLNIWAPEEDSAQKRPVLVYIHGGGFSGGSPAQLILDGSRFAKEGIVQVNITYRLGALGFMAFPEVEAEYGNFGNNGILDQIAALQWVKQNIGAFGGDADNVTICGESAGAFSVSCLMLSELAKGLFRRAILESGNLLCQPIISPRAPGWRVQAASASRRYMRSLGAENLEQLRGCDPVAIAAGCAFKDDMTRPPLYNFWPVFDGHVLPENPYKALVEGKVNCHEMLAGFNANEGTLFVPRGASEEDYAQLADNIFKEDAWKWLERYPAEGQHGASKRARMLVGLGLRFGSDVFADAMSQAGDSVFYYGFDFHEPILDVAGLGTMHALELLFVFATIPPLIQMDERISACVEYTHNAWRGFVAEGDVNRFTSAQQPQWPRYTAADRQLMVISDRPGAGPVPGVEEVAFCLELLWQHR